MHTRDDLSQKVISRFWSRVDRFNEDMCWEWTGHFHRQGYGVISIGPRMELAHRVSFLIAFGFLPPAVLHKCDHPPCVNPRHLFGGTQAENMQDMVRKWRKPGKITPAVKSTILALHECGMTQAAIARQVGVTDGSIRAVLRRQIRYNPTD